MKTLALLFLAAALTLSSCATGDYGPTVSNRDAKGRFTTPACPKCGEVAKASRTVYECVNGHIYSTEPSSN